MTPEEHSLARLALEHTPHVWLEPSDPEHEMIVARAAVHLAAMVIRGELKIPDWNTDTPTGSSEQAIVDYLISRIRMAFRD